MAVSSKDAPFCEPYAAAGNPKGFRSKGPTAEAVKRALAHLGFMEWKEDFDQHWNLTVNDAAAAWKRKRGLIPADSNDGSWGEKAHDVMRSAWFEKNGDHLPAFDGGSQKLLKQEKQAGAGDVDNVPDLGPVWQGGLSVLDQDLTHATSGISLYPAFDDAFVAGRDIIAPEDISVVKASSSNPGDAFYAEGKSKIDYWFGHLVSAPTVGMNFKKGARIGTVLNHNVGGGPHTHVGINVERLLGNGEQLDHHTNYTHGAPTVGEQLSKAL
jgi:hypothetical protein